MILVDVMVPSINKKYDFKLNENVLISEVITEISEVICSKERFLPTKDYSNMLLCDKVNEKILHPDMTLFEAGIKTGDMLILV